MVRLDYGDLFLAALTLGVLGLSAVCYAYQCGRGRRGEAFADGYRTGRACCATTLAVRADGIEGEATASSPLAAVLLRQVAAELRQLAGEFRDEAKK